MIRSAKTAFPQCAAGLCEKHNFRTPADSVFVKSYIENFLFNPEDCGFRVTIKKYSFFDFPGMTAFSTVPENRVPAIC
jgi:hypothetical protein